MHRMQVRSFLVSFFVLVCSGTCALHAAPAPQEEPRVHGDRTVTFQLRMPFAQQVRLNIDPGLNLPMTRGADGDWSVTTPSLAPDIYGYSFVVDGTRIADPANTHAKSNMLTPASLVEVPAETPQPWDDAPIAHGELHHRYFASQTAHDSRDYYVYTPPGFDPRAATRYPVLYLLHGFSDAANAWVDVGRANFILDTLIDAGRAKPMIVVMPLGYGVSSYAVRGSPGFNDAQLTQRNFDGFRLSLITEVMPQVEREYPILAGAQNRAIAGLSMGGSETLDTALNHPELFAWVGSFSMGGLMNGVAGDDFGRIFPRLEPARQPRLLWIACGTEDGFLRGNRQLIAWLRERGDRPVAIETPGSHDWSVWRHNLIAFLPLLFQDSPRADAAPQP